MKVIQTIAWLFPYVCLFSLMRKMLYNCAPCCSANRVYVRLSLRSCCQSSPESQLQGPRHERWAAQSERWSPNTAFTQLSAYGDATPAQQWHFLPRCAEGTGFYLAGWAEIFSSLCGRLFTETIQEREGVTCHLQQKKNTEKKKNQCTPE